MSFYNLISLGDIMEICHVCDGDLGLENFIHIKTSSKELFERITKSFENSSMKIVGSHFVIRRLRSHYPSEKNFHISVDVDDKKDDLQKVKDVLSKNGLGMFRDRIKRICSHCHKNVYFKEDPAAIWSSRYAWKWKYP